MALRDRLQACLGSRFVLEGPAGGGGMALVFRARDTKLGRTVAVKLLRPELATAVGAERFLREARALAALSHPNVIHVHECGEAGGLFWYVMDFEASPTLRERLSEGPLPRRDAFRLGKDLLSGLAAAHAAGILHRDVKPSNIFWREDRAVLADFGVAAAEDEPGQRRERLTTDTTPGTFAYMAPEVLAGAEATARSDLYAAAMVIYEAFTGRRWAPGPRRSRDVWSEVPRRARAVLAHGLEPDPERRWPAAASFRRALQRAGRRRPVGLLVAAAVAGAVIVASVAFFVPSLLDGLGPRAAAYEIAMFPCSTPDPSDSLDGWLVARAAATYFQPGTDVRVAPFDLSATEWDSHHGEVPDSVRRGRLGARWAVTCSLRETAADHWTLGVKVADGKDVLVERAFLPTAPDRQKAATGLWRLIYENIREVPMPADQEPYVARYPAEAQRLYTLGLQAFAEDQLAQASDLFREAWNQAPGFALAAWHLAEAERWLAHSSVSVDLDSLHRNSAGKLGARDSMLLAARAERYGPAKFRAYEAATERFPHDPYVTLLYGDELYHRGGLWGIPLDSGIARLDAAMREDSTLAPAVEHATQAWIRSGDSLRARSALHTLKRLWTQRSGEVDYRAVWTAAYVWRFRSRGEALEELAELLEGRGEDRIDRGKNLLRLAARWVRYVDLPDLQLLVGRRLESEGRIARAGPDIRSGRLAAGIGLLQTGRIAEAQGVFDSLAAGGEPRFAVQADEWKVIPYALRLEGFERSAAATGAKHLRELIGARPGSLVPYLRARAAFALGLLALRDEDTLGARTWADSLSSLEGAGPSERTERLEQLLRAALAAQARDPRAALVESSPLTEYDSTAAALYPFERATAYWLRGSWYAAEALPDSAIRSWYWQENTDLEEGTPPGVIQAAEVDAGFGPHARAKIALIASGASWSDLAGLPRCELVRSRSGDLARTWTDELPGIGGVQPLDPSLAALRDSVTRAARRACPNP